jgi:hypothetical protein
VEVDVKAASLLVEEYREGKLTQKASLEFSQPQKRDDEHP